MAREYHGVNTTVTTHRDEMCELTMREESTEERTHCSGYHGVGLQRGKLRRFGGKAPGDWVVC